MPLKINQSLPTDVCCICCHANSAKDEALLCVGRCQQQLHCYCASVPEQQYKILCEKHILFLCPSCYWEQHKGKFKELKGTVDTLKVELSQLKELLSKVEGQVKHSAYVPYSCRSSPHIYAATIAATANHNEKVRSTAVQGDTQQHPKWKRPPGWQTVDGKPFCQRSLASHGDPRMTFK